MGNMFVFSAIEQEEKALRMQEDRNNIYEQINEIEDIQTDAGKREIAYLTEQFEKTFAADSDDEDGISDKDVIFTSMPWADLQREEDRENLRKHCRVLAKKEDLLVKLKPQLEYGFNFDLEKYTFLAIVLSKLYPGLAETRLRLVPDEVTESEFWCNYFYRIELWKQQGGFTSRLGERIDTAERDAAIQEELRKAEEEIKRLKQSAPDAATGQKVGAEDADSSAVTEMSMVRGGNET